MTAVFTFLLEFIFKAVDCPLNLDSNSECGRVVDEVSCYCVTTTAVSPSNDNLRLFLP
jgi:hypothetical protein